MQIKLLSRHDLGDNVWEYWKINIINNDGKLIDAVCLGIIELNITKIHTPRQVLTPKPKWQEDPKPEWQKDPEPKVQDLVERWGKIIDDFLNKTDYCKKCRSETMSGYNNGRIKNE